jgi:Zn-dependent M28 family amino/carboxypeptidase
MGHRMDKLYAGIPNIILRISNGTAAGKAHAILINAHYDSQLPGPGATDDALGVGVMLEAARVLIHDPSWTPERAVVFRKHSACAHNMLMISRR